MPRNGPISFAAVPDDIIFTILRFCFLPEYYALSMTCSAFYNLSCRRGYWIDALRVTRPIHPIACTLHEDLSTHTYESLKKIASRTMRLKHNWALPQPKIDGPIKVVMLDPINLDIIFQVPGTDLYVFHSRDTGTVCAWDVGIGKRVSPEIYVSTRLVDVSPGQDLPGKFSMGLLTSSASEESPANELVIVCLEYGLSRLQGRVHLSLSFRYVFEPCLFHWAVFLSNDYVGVLRRIATHSAAALEGRMLDIVAVNLKTRRETVITTDIPLEFLAISHNTGTTTLDNDMFILIEARTTSSVIKCPKDYLPHDNNPDIAANSTLKCKAGSSLHKWQPEPGYEFRFSEGALSADQQYGVPAVSLHRISMARETIMHDTDSDMDSDVEEDISSMQIRFWGKPSKSDLRAGFHYLAPKRVVNIPGCLQDSPGSAWQLMLIPHSGRKVLIVMRSMSNINLILVHGDCEPGEESVNTLVLPDLIDLRDVYGLSLDDHRGVVTLLSTNGCLFAIPYA